MSRTTLGIETRRAPLTTTAQLFVIERTMFEFNDAYIGVVAGGMSDADTLSLFQDAFGEMGVEVAKRLRRVDGDLGLEWDSEGPFVYLTEDQFLAEFGDLESPASYRISQAFIRSSHDASKAFEEVVQG